MGKLSRNKGAAWEREVANRLTEVTGVTCRRCLIETQQGNQGDIATELPFVFQCKVGKNPTTIGAFLEAKLVADRRGKEETPGVPTTPVAIVKRNGKQGGGCPPVELAVVPLEWFYDVLERMYGRP